jgi:iron-sulfur cluster repair protein YtfE (RIC family)
MTLAATKTVGEIAAEIPSTTREFEKLGIDYCCGGSRGRSRWKGSNNYQPLNR